MKVLIVKTTSLGDVIHTLPALTDASKEIEGIVFDWLVEESFQNIPQWHANVNKVIPVATRRWRKNIWRSRHEIRQCYQNLVACEYDVVIDAQGLFKSALLTKLAKTKRRVGYDKNSIKEPLASNGYDQTIGVDKKQHAVLRVRKLFAAALGYDCSKMALDYGIDAYFECADKKVSAQNQPYVVFLHGTTWASKHWPKKYWQQLGQRFNQQGYNVLLSWGNAAEKQNAMDIASQINNVKILDKQSIEDFAKVLTNATIAIAVDTGLGHLAAALSVPCVSIYGATDAQKTGAMGHRQVHLSGQYHCAPCLKKRCQFSEREYEDFPPCYQTNNPEDVYKAAMNLLADTL